MYQLDYEDQFMENEIVIDEALADELDGRCFVDLDMSERVEGFKFTKTKTGIDLITIGAGPFLSYNFITHDDYGTYKVEDTFIGTDVILVKNKFELLRETTEEIFNKMLKIVNDQRGIIDDVKREFNRKQKEVFIEAGIY